MYVDSTKYFHVNSFNFFFAENVDQIDECGNLDYNVLKPVLERAKPDDLMRIEEYNPRLMDDTGEYTNRHSVSMYGRTRNSLSLTVWKYGNSLTLF